MNDTNGIWPAATALLRTPMAIVRQELVHGKRHSREPIDVAGRLLAAEIGVSKREDDVEIAWLTREQAGTPMAIRLRRTPAGATVETRGPQYEYRQPPHVQIGPEFVGPDNEHATLAASMGTLCGQSSPPYSRRARASIGAALALIAQPAMHVPHYAPDAADPQTAGKSDLGAEGDTAAQR